ncbi:MAG: hypothetical protein IJT94_08410 [Oscillibacter sp.]|nr:hypothetical protein [Oscillibacter sp.]
MSMESDGMALLRRQLDESLRQHAKDLGACEGLPEIADIYAFQIMAEVHEYLKTEHPFTPKEVNTLLEFADPLEVAAGCWEVNPDRYALDICGIIEANAFRESYPPAEKRQEPEKQSLKARLREAQRESRRQAREGTAERPGKSERPGKGGESL